MHMNMLDSTTAQARRRRVCFIQLARLSDACTGASQEALTQMSSHTRGS
jgi:hypothetical protein